MNGKQTVYTAVFKFREGSFKHKNITDTTGLSSSLVTHHLNTLMDQGLIAKLGQGYCVTDPSKLADALLETQEGRTQTALPHDTIYLTFTSLKEAIQHAVRARNAEIHNWQVYHREVNDDIDDAIRQLRLAKKYLNNKRMTPERARSELTPVQVGHFDYPDTVQFNDRTFKKSHFAEGKQYWQCSAGKCFIKDPESHNNDNCRVRVTN